MSAPTIEPPRLVVKHHRASVIAEACEWLEDVKVDLSRSSANDPAAEATPGQILLSLARSGSSQSDQERLAKLLLWFADHGWLVRDLRHVSSSEDMQELAVELLHTFEFSQRYTAHTSSAPGGLLPEF